MLTTNPRIKRAKRTSLLTYNQTQTKEARIPNITGDVLDTWTAIGRGTELILERSDAGGSTRKSSFQYLKYSGTDQKTYVKTRNDNFKFPLLAACQKRLCPLYSRIKNEDAPLESNNQTKIKGSASIS